MTSGALSRNRIVVDTDVISYLFNGHTQGAFFKPYLSNKTLAISFMTVAELYYGAYHANWGESRLAKLENHLKNYVVLPYDHELCLRWARIRRDGENNGLSIERSDCWIAATAMRHDCTLATNNGNHFTHIKGLTLISPGLL